MKCFRCASERIAKVVGKTDDRCDVRVAGVRKDGYMPDDMGVGGGDYLNFEYCLDCGTIQGHFPIPETEIVARHEENSEEAW